MRFFKEPYFLKSLTTAEKKKIRKIVISELERYRFLKQLEQLSEEQEAFCRRIEKSIEGLPEIEKFIINNRYINPEAEYVTDYQVYNMLMEPPVSEKTYSKMRNSAMLKMALFLGLDIGIDVFAD